MSKRDEEEIMKAIEAVSPSDYLFALDRDRPYDGQSWTDEGFRGKQEVRGIAMRDVKDCYIRACYECARLSPGEYPKSIYELNWDEIDPMAVIQTTLCWVEKYMGIFPNVPPISQEEIWGQIPIVELKGDER